MAQRRRVVAVVGDNALSSSPEDQHKRQTAEALGRALVDAGWRVLTGGLGGVMEAACRGAHVSSRYREGDTIAVLPGDDPAAANAFADIAIATGLGPYRNGIVGRADAVVAVGGGAGTLQEVATAWKARRPLVVMVACSGLTAALAGQRLDARGGPDRPPVQGASSAAEAVALLRGHLGHDSGPAA